MPQVKDILAHKGSHVLTVSPQGSVLDAVAIMNEHRIGSVVVCERRQVVGMFTERDLLVRVVSPGLDPAQTRVRDVMTQEVVVCDIHCDIDEVRTMFKERRIRHLPILDAQSQLVGLVSIGDLNAWMIDGHEATIHHLHEYLYGRV